MDPPEFEVKKPSHSDRIELEISDNFRAPGSSSSPDANKDCDELCGSWETK